MSQQYPPQPQQPGWNGPHQPGQPGPQQGWGVPPQPPKKNNVGKIIGLGCGGILLLFVVILIIGVAVGGTDTASDASSNSGDAKATHSARKDEEKPAADGKGTDDGKKTAEAKPEKKTVTFKVWGTAPAGALGPLNITYGSDSDSRQGEFKNGTFETTLPLDDDAMYYMVSAQLQGSGDINCSITVDGHTEKAHASGGYNICHAQANAGLLGGWS
ncbi:hypothetical protein ACQEV4_42640 [Streptomyces shenzhenensis]|uniref:hypothetical protein n=1 Tax=Streptomyces shenzhenensis TaxID=943815 RepID=UPI003D8E700E